jgi:hypothetical protein
LSGITQFNLTIKDQIYGYAKESSGKKSTCEEGCRQESTRKKSSCEESSSEEGCSGSSEEGTRH